jgi:hypothetical protein
VPSTESAFIRNTAIVIIELEENNGMLYGCQHFTELSFEFQICDRLPTTSERFKNQIPVQEKTTSYCRLSNITEVKTPLLCW